MEGTVRRWTSLLIAIVVLCVFASNVYAHYFIVDDAFISFRYAENLVAGHGLVWNPGERVEGYTNFLWVLLMAGGLLLSVPPEILANALGIASGALVLGLVAWYDARRSGWSDLRIWLAPALLAVSRTFGAWCTGGLEEQFFSFLVFAGVVRFAIERESSGRSRPVSAMLLALATLTRPEGVIFAAVAGLFFAIEIVDRHRPLRALFAWTAIYGAVVGAHVAWRLAYYGFPFPNTFYAKVNGVFWSQGLRYLALFGRDYGAVFLVPLAAAAIVIRRRFSDLLFASCIVVFGIYVAAIGGDYFEFRFLVVILPMLYLLSSAGVWAVGDLVPGRTWTRLVASGVMMAAACALVAMTYRGSTNPEATRFRDGVTSLPLERAYARMRIRDGKFLRYLVETGRLPGDLRIAVGGAGAVPYFSGLHTVDFRGLNDVAIAHLPPPRHGLIAHERMAPYEYLVSKRIAIFDVLNRIVHEGDPGRFPRSVSNVRYQGPLRCVEADGRYLLFATTLPEDEFRRVFGAVTIVY